jgi:hypothetical protein
MNEKRDIDRELDRMYTNYSMYTMYTYYIVYIVYILVYKY